MILLSNKLLMYSLFLLLPLLMNCQSKTVFLTEENGALVISVNESPVLNYQFEFKELPQGMDPAYRRSGYIHPLRTLKGHVLTRIQPPDHLHHYGVMNPWTHTLVEGDTIDFWNLGKKEGTVRFAGFQEQIADRDKASFQAMHEHVVLKNGSDKVVLNEVHEVEVTCSDDDHFIVDFTFTYRCAAEQPFKILTYRYGGFLFRGTETWNDRNSSILTSEGETRDGAEGTRARWTMVQGPFGDQTAGALLFSHPENYNHPEPLRIWPPDAEGEGDVFINISPTKTKDWQMEPGQTYVLQYRMVVFDGEMGKEEAEGHWERYIQL